jgi:hypothetical protein
VAWARQDGVRKRRQAHDGTPVDATLWMNSPARRILNKDEGDV